MQHLFAGSVGDGAGAEAFPSSLSDGESLESSIASTADCGGTPPGHRTPDAMGSSVGRGTGLGMPCEMPTLDMDALANGLAGSNAVTSTRDAVRYGEEQLEEGLRLRAMGGGSLTSRDQAGESFMRAIMACDKVLGDAFLDSEDEEELEEIAGRCHEQLNEIRGQGWSSEAGAAGLPPLSGAGRSDTSHTGYGVGPPGDEAFDARFEVQPMRPTPTAAKRVPAKPSQPPIPGMFFADSTSNGGAPPGEPDGAAASDYTDDDTDYDDADFAPSDAGDGPNGVEEPLVDTADWADTDAAIVFPVTVRVRIIRNARA